MALPHFPSRKILSCGIVPVHFDGQRYRLLALRSSSGWDFPKALLTGGRDPQQVAIGAARDVTGLTELEFSWGEDAFRETIASDDGNVSRYYLAQSKTAEVALRAPPGADKHDVEYRWVTPEDAEDILPPRLALILDWAIEQLAAGAS
jgi:NUDIX domain